MHTLLATQILADPSTKGAGSWIKDNVVFILLVVIGCVLLTGALRGNFSRVASVFALGIVGLFWVGLSFSGKSDGLSTFLLGLVGI